MAAPARFATKLTAGAFAYPIAGLRLPDRRYLVAEYVLGGTEAELAHAASQNHVGSKGAQHLIVAAARVDQRAGQVRKKWVDLAKVEAVAAFLREAGVEDVAVYPVALHESVL